MKKLLVVVFLLTSLSAFAGNELGNGGDFVAQQFIAAGKRLVTDLRAKPDPRIPDVDALARAVDQVKVTSSEHLTLHGAEVDAINYPEDRHIDLNRPRWEESDPEKRASLVLHEYLGILQVPDLHYEISASYAQPFALPEEKPKRFLVEAGATYGGQYYYGEHNTGPTPGVSVSAGYAVAPRSTLLLEFDRQAFVNDWVYGNYSERNTLAFTSLSLGWRQWWSLSRDWRPFAQLNAGYVRESSSEVGMWGANDSWGEAVYTHQSPYSYGGNFLLGISAGIRYALLRDVGLDLAGRAQHVGTPWHWKSADKLAAAQFGMDVVF